MKQEPNGVGKGKKLIHSSGRGSDEGNPKEPSWQQQCGERDARGQTGRNNGAPCGCAVQGREPKTKAGARNGPKQREGWGGAREGGRGNGSMGTWQLLRRRPDGGRVDGRRVPEDRGGGGLCHKGKSQAKGNGERPKGGTTEEH